MEIALSNITHRFGDLTALENVSLHAHEGEIVAIIGPSGCGKSTLLGIAGGILKPTAGEVVLRGVPAPDYAERDHFHLPGFLAAALAQRARQRRVRVEAPQARYGRDARRIANALERTGLSDFASALPKQLSGGMRQRVGIARALAVAPRRVLDGRAAVGARRANARAVARRHSWRSGSAIIRRFCTSRTTFRKRFASPTASACCRVGRGACARSSAFRFRARSGRRTRASGRGRRARRAVVVADQRGGDRGRSRARDACLSRAPSGRRERSRARSQAHVPRRRLRHRAAHVDQHRRVLGSDRALATRDRDGPHQPDLPAVADARAARALRSRDHGRSLAARVGVARPHRLRLVPRHGVRRRLRSHDRPVHGVACRWLAARCGVFSDSEDRAAAALDSLARHRRRLEGRDDRAQRVLPRR